MLGTWEMIDTDDDEYEGMIRFDDLDECIIGTGVNDTGASIFIYGYDELVEFFEDEFVDHDEAVEWVEFNVLGVRTANGPVVMTRLD